MQAADGATIELTPSTSGRSVRLMIDFYGLKQVTFLTAKQLRELAGECERLARELEAADAVS